MMNFWKSVSKSNQASQFHATPIGVLMVKSTLQTTKAIIFRHIGF